MKDCAFISKIMPVLEELFKLYRFYVIIFYFTLYNTIKQICIHVCVKFSVQWNKGREVHLFAVLSVKRMCVNNK